MEAAMTKSPPSIQWTLHDLEGLPDTSDRYEIINGDLHVTRAPRIEHQDAAGAIYAELRAWSKQSGFGKAIFAPGVVFSEVSAVIPDVVWVSQRRLERIVDAAGHLMEAPELIIEVLSKSKNDQKRDRETKLKLYSIEGVVEYWILNPELNQCDIYRRKQGLLQKAITLYPVDELQSPLLPGFATSVGSLFS